LNISKIVILYLILLYILYNDILQLQDRRGFLEEHSNMIGGTIS